MTIIPCNPAVLDLNTGSYDTKVGGMYRSLHTGATWSRIGRVQPNDTGTDHLDVPIDIRIDAANPLHIYAMHRRGARSSGRSRWRRGDGAGTLGDDTKIRVFYAATSVVSSAGIGPGGVWRLVTR